VRTIRAAALLWIAIGALSAPLVARADDDRKDAPPTAAASDEASRRFKSGVAFYKDKDFTAAMVEFKRAYELVPNYNVLFNLGQTARELKDYASALSAFDQYLRDGGGKIASGRRKEVTAAIDELRKKVGNLKIAASVEGAEIVVDDVPVGVSPLPAPVVVNVGRHKLTATAKGYAPATRQVDVASMEETAATLDLPKLDAGPPKIVPADPTPPKRGPSPLAWGALAGTGALAIAAGVTGGLAVSAHGGLESALATFPGDPKAIADAQKKTRTFAVTTDVLGALALAGAVTTVVLFVVAPRGAEKAKASVGVSPGGVVVRGVF
jgi:PEGA domain